MIIKLKDGTQITVSKLQADKVKTAIESDAKAINLDDKWFRSDWIASIMPGGQTEADKIPEHRQISPADHRGEYSPAKEKIRENLRIKKDA